MLRISALARGGWVVRVASAVLLSILLASLLSACAKQQKQPSANDLEIAKYEALVLTDPGNLVNLSALANLYLQGKQYDRAIATYQKVLAEQQDDIGSLIGLGMAYYQKGDDRRSAECFQRVIELNANAEFARLDRRLELAHFYLGTIDMKAKKYADAEQEFREALKIEAANADNFYRLGEALRLQGKLDDALDAYQKAASFAPDFLEVYRGMATVYGKQGNEGRKAYASGMAALFSGDLRGAVSQLTKATQLTPKQADAWWGLGYAYEKQGNPTKALACYNTALGVDSSFTLASQGIDRIKKGGPATGTTKVKPKQPGALDFLYAIYGVDQPFAIAISPDGKQLYVSERSGQRYVKVLDVKGNLIATLAPPGTDKDSRNPTYLAVNPQGYLFVNDTYQDGLSVYSPDGTFQGLLNPMSGSSGKTPWRPMALAFDKNGNLYVTDLIAGSHRVDVFDAQDKLKLQFGTQGQAVGQFAYPNGIAVDKDGNIWVADSSNSRIQVFDSTGAPKAMSSTAGGESLSQPRGLSIGPGGEVAVADLFDHTVDFFDVGNIKNSYKSGDHGIENGQFRYPNSLVFDRLNVLYVADRDNNRIQVFQHRKP